MQYTKIFFICKNSNFNGKNLIFLIVLFVRLCVLVLGEAVLTCTHNQCFKQKYQHFSNEISFFFTAEKNLHILHGQVPGQAQTLQLVIQFIRETCPYNIYTLILQFYIGILGYTCFLIFDPKHSGYSLERF